MRNSWMISYRSKFSWGRKNIPTLIEYFQQIHRICSGREISYFGLVRNLIQHLISPNQDDLSYSARTSFIRAPEIG